MSNCVIISVDVEDWYHGPTMIQSGIHPAQRNLGDDGFENLERAYPYINTCLELFSAHGIKATFFWVAEYAKRFPHLVRAVVAEGHEIACHGLWHASKFDPAIGRNIYSRNEFKKMTSEARAILEDQGGKQVIGYRAPNAYISGAMIDDLEDLGFRYDSSVSVNSLYNKTDSTLLTVSTAPYYPRRGGLEKASEPRSIIEFPWPYWEVLGFKLQSAGGPFLRVLGSTLITAGIRQSLRRGHTFFYFHPVDLCNEAIPMPFDWRRPMMWTIKGDLVRRRVNRILQAFAPCNTNFASIIDEAVPQ